MNAARSLSIAPSPEESLRREITEVCEQIDRRLGNRPGTAEKGCFFWLWPPVDSLDAEVLKTLHADATALLGDIVSGRLAGRQI